MGGVDKDNKFTQFEEAVYILYGKGISETDFVINDYVRSLLPQKEVLTVSEYESYHGISEIEEDDYIIVEADTIVVNAFLLNYNEEEYFKYLLTTHEL